MLDISREYKKRYEGAKKKCKTTDDRKTATKSIEHTAIKIPKFLLSHTIGRHVLICALYIFSSMFEIYKIFLHKNYSREIKKGMTSPKSHKIA